MKTGIKFWHSVPLRRLYVSQYQFYVIYVSDIVFALFVAVGCLVTFAFCQHYKCSFCLCSNVFNDTDNWDSFVLFARCNDQFRKRSGKAPPHPGQHWFTYNIMDNVGWSVFNFISQKISLKGGQPSMSMLVIQCFHRWRHFCLFLLRLRALPLCLIQTFNNKKMNVLT